MRQIIVDTETTGLDPALGHRIIEIAAVEVVNRRLTENHFHRYVNPERDSEEAAMRVHGLTTEFLCDKPRFREIVRDFLDFIGGAELIIHNAAFDVAFIDHELSLLDLEPLTTCCSSVIDTLKMAREIHPGKRNALDALCERYEIDNSARTLHGALLDAQLLAEVYLAMTRGQESLIMEEESLHITVTPVHVSRVQLTLRVLAPTLDEVEAHEAALAAIDKASAGACIWKKLLHAQTTCEAAA
ncbi:MAG TPA: DNA polymerase III subunit epsilon [Burkholderiales bacterium]